MPDRLNISDLRRSSAFRLLWRLGLAWVVGVALLLGIIYHLTAREVVRRSDDILQRRMHYLRSVSDEARPRAVHALSSMGGRDFDYAVLYASTGERVAGNIALSDLHIRSGPFDIAPGGGHGPLRAMIARMGNGETIAVAHDATLVLDLRRRLLWMFSVAGGLGMVGILAVAVAVSIRPIRRVRHVQRIARAIGTGHYGMPMPIDGRGDELDLLAHTVNMMVDEVSRLVVQVRSATDAVAHDLRTPLTRLKARLHAAGVAAPPDSPVKALAADAIEDLDIVLGRFAALMRISMIEAAYTRQLAPVELASLIAEVVAFYEPIAEEAGIRLDMLHPDRAVSANGDRELLFEAIANLLDNAIKFAAGHVHIALEDAPGGPAVRVIDDGCGIPMSDRENVLRRFHRGSAATDKPGAGLGLSIVAAIAHLHRADLSFSDAMPGLMVELRLMPVAP